MSTIPVLQDGDFIFAESHAIILYLVNKYGGEHKAALYPFDPQTRALVNQCLHFDAGVMFRRLQDVASLCAGLILWKHEASPPSNAVRMLAAMLGLQLELEEPNLPAREHKTPQFKKMNPMGTVPVLKHGDFFISDSHAIMLYLLRKYGGHHTEALYPSELRTRALVDRALHFDTGVVFSQLLDVIKASFQGTLSGPTRAQIEQITDAYAVLEALLESRPYVAAGHVTVADVALGSSVAALQAVHGLDPKEFPRTRAWLDRMEAESYFKEIGTPGAARLAAILNRLW